MLKRVTLLLFAMMFINTVIANPQKKAVRNKVDRNIIGERINLDRGGLVETVILTEDFSKFTEGSEEDPDDLRLDDIETLEIDDKYFNTPGWRGLEVYQAGGCAYLGFSNEYGEPGLISTPLINTEGSTFIKCRMRSENPEGEIVGYNILDKDLELVDANVDFIEITQEWTDVSWFTPAGCEESYVYIFSYSSNVFIDDIEIISCSLSEPVLLEETNVGNNTFTANWEAVEGCDAYIFKLYAEHTATTEETFYYTNTDFSNVISEGTISSPETVEDWKTTINGWHIYMPVLIDEAVGITGRYSSIEQYGAMTSPVLDLSSNNGNVNLTFKAHGQINDVLEINLLTPAHGYYDIASSSVVTIENEGWNEYSVTLTKGMEESYIDITYFGLGDVFIDDINLYQTIDEGETKILILENIETEETSHKVKIEERYLEDVLYYQVAASKFVYSPNGEKIIGAIDSKFTENRTVTLGNGDTTEESETINIGNGEINTYYAPVSNYGNSANFSVSQQIYTKEEINKENGTITSISFQNNNGNANIRNLVVYMSNTSQEAYRDNKDWVLLNESEMVFEGGHEFGAQSEWTTIILDNPFIYTGENIAITIYDKSDFPFGYSGYDTFFATATDTLRGLYKTSTEKINVFNLEEVYGYELKTSTYSTPANQYYVNNIKLDIEPYTGDDETESISMPKNISAVAIDTSSIRISWTNVKNASAYKVYRNGNEVANITETYYLDTNLDDNTKYCYNVTALNGDLESEKSEEVCATTLENKIIIPDGIIDEIETSFTIYPNPVENELFITTELCVEEISIYDIYGRETMRQQVNKLTSQQVIDVTDLNSGVYFVKVVTDGSEVVKRFVKK